MNEEIIEKYMQRIETRLSDAESAIDFARDEIEELTGIIQITDEVYNFVEKLTDSPNVSEEIREEASELWKKI